MEDQVLQPQATEDFDPSGRFGMEAFTLLGLLVAIWRGNLLFRGIGGLGGFQQCGLAPGPLLFVTNADLVWGLIASARSPWSPR
jgi:hypothetical protein